MNNAYFICMALQNFFTRLYCMCYVFTFKTSKFAEKRLQTYSTDYDNNSVPYFKDRMRYKAVV